MQRLDSTTYELASLNRDLSVRERGYEGLVSFIQDIGRALILAAIVYFASIGSGFSNVADAYFLVSIFARLMAPIRSLFRGVDDVFRSLAISKTLLGLLVPTAATLTGQQADAPPDATDKTVAAQFTDAGFRYGTNEWAVKDCSFRVPMGGVTLLVGRSGAGKTTIARMLLGFLRTETGWIEVLGRQVVDWDHEKLLAQMSYLSQTGHVVMGTVRENLFAREDLDESELVSALLQARLATSDTEAIDLLDSEARDLSEGQRQRLALARILADRSAIVVLDEPLSGIDAFTFHEVRPSLTAWLANSKRTVVISHRLAFASTATHVVMLGDAGKVVEEGAPATLERSGGRSLSCSAQPELS